MKLLSSHRLTPLVLLASLLSATACSKKEAPSTSDTSEAPRPQGVQLDFVPSDQDRETINTLLGRLNQKTQRFAYSEASKKSNAKLFTYLAATSDDPVVIAASLQAIQSSYSHRSPQKEKPDADLDRVLIKHLGSTKPNILGRALMASRISLMRPDPDRQLVEAIVKLAAAHPDGPGRYGVLDALRALRGAARTPEVIDVFRSSLKSREPYVLSIALQGLHDSAKNQAQTTELRDRALELTESDDPGVRGRALQLVSALGSNDHAPTLERVRAALSDEHPYVRAEACEAVARLGDKASIHALMDRIEDKERSFYDLRGWKLLDGRNGNVRHRIARRSKVQEAALAAIAGLSDGQLSLERIDRKQRGQALEKNVDLAKAWYVKAKATLPQAPPQPTASAPSKPLAGPAPSPGKAAEPAPPATP